MKILHLCSEYPPQRIYGLGRAVRELAVAQTALGHDVHVVTNSMSGSDHEVDDQGVHVHRVHFPPPPKPADEITTVVQFNVQAVERVAGARFSEGIDLIHSHDWLTGLAGLAARSLLDAPLAITVHDTAYGKSLGNIDATRRYVMDIEQHTFSSADLLVCPSEFIQREVAVAYGVAGRHVVVVPQGVQPVPEGTERDGCTVLYVGRLDPEKGVDVLLDAAEEVLKEHIQAEFLLAGTGKLEDALRQQASRLGGAVQFLGYVADPIPLYQKATVVVVPSLYEPFGLVALEGMVSGAPVIVSETGGLAEIVTDGSDGLGVPPGDRRALARALSQLLADKALRDQLGAAARRTCEQRFTWEAVARGYVRAYEGTSRDPATVLVLADDPDHPVAREVLAVWEQAEVDGFRFVREAESPDLIHFLRTSPEPPHLTDNAPVVETVLTWTPIGVEGDEADRVVFGWRGAALGQHDLLSSIGLGKVSYAYPGVAAPVSDRPPDKAACRQRLGLPRDVPVIGILGSSEAHALAIREQLPQAHVIEPTEGQLAALDVAVCPQPRDEDYRSLVLCGLNHVPIVGPQCGLLAEPTENRWSGLLNDGSPEACARDVQEALRDPDRLRWQQRLSHEVASSRFSAGKFTRYYRRLFDRVLGGARSTAPFFLSIVIDVRDRGKLLLRNLQTLLQQSASADSYEVIVVDYGGTDELERSLPDDPRIRYIYSHSRGLFSHGRARNVGIRAAKGDAIACVDADLLFPSRFVEALIELHRSDDSLAVYTDVYQLGDDTQQLIEANERSVLEDFTWLRDHAETHFRQATVGGLQSASRWAWFAIAGYDEDFVGYGMEDIDLAERFWRIGLLPVFHPEVYVLHQHHGYPRNYRTRSIHERNHRLQRQRATHPVRNRGGDWGRRRPRPMPRGRPRVLLVADIPGSETDEVAVELGRRLGDQFTFETRYRPAPGESMPDAASFDVACFLSSGAWVACNGDPAFAGKAVSFVRSEAGLHPLAIPALNECQIVAAVTRRLLWRCRSQLGTPAVYAPIGVDVELFCPGPWQPGSRLRVGSIIAADSTSARRAVEEALSPATSSIDDVELVLLDQREHVLSIPELVDFYRSIDAYVHVSADEALHMPLLQAGACAVPLISTNVGVAPELIENGQNGLIAERSAEHVRRAFQLLAGQRHAAREMGLRCRESIEAGWSWDSLAPRYAHLFSFVTDRPAQMRH